MMLIILYELNHVWSLPTVKDLLFDRSSRRAPKIAEISQEIFSRFGLSRSGFAGYDDALRLFQHFHVSEGFVACDRKAQSVLSLESGAN
jgi:hypothetical protein